MRALFLTKYGPQAASTRYRFLQYLPSLAAADISVTTSALLDDEYLGRKFEDGRSPVGLAARGYLRRLQALLEAGKYDVVVIHCELFPFVPALAEKTLRWRGIPYVLDFDDAIFHTYDQHDRAWVRTLLGQKIAHAIRDATAVAAGNEYLAAYSRRYNNRVEVLPTVVDLDRYQPRPKRSAVFTVGWLGSPSTAVYVRGIEAALARLFAEVPGRLVLVGSGPMTLAGVPLDVHPWSEASELDELTEFDVGIMPLSDTPWSRGKCGFKLIQYMAAGLPVVASPVGVNATIVDPGTNGLLATSDEEWVAALRQLAADPALRERMGRAGRQKVADRYELRGTAPRLIRLLESAARG